MKSTEPLPHHLVITEWAYKQKIDSIKQRDIAENDLEYNESKKRELDIMVYAYDRVLSKDDFEIKEPMVREFLEESQRKNNKNYNHYATRCSHLYDRLQNLKNEAVALTFLYDAVKDVVRERCSWKQFDKLLFIVEGLDES